MKLPQLSLRELFLLVVIAAVCCGWWVDRARLAKEVDRLTFQYCVDRAVAYPENKPPAPPDWDGTPITLSD